MKRIKHLLLFVGTALFLAACGTGGNGGGVWSDDTECKRQVAPVESDS